MSSEPYDLVIVGGGITGAGIARDAVLRGLKVILLEKNDYGSGTSSKSSKMIHGGLRYLENGELGMVFESVSERAVQARVAPHIVRPLPFLMPIYEETKPGLELINIGLWIYDTFALFRNKRHKTYRGAKAVELIPQLRTEKLSGALEYYDCVTDDSRLVLENIIDAKKHGAECHSYTKVMSLVRDYEGRVTGVKARNELTDEEMEVKTRAVILAAGAWTDEVIDSLDVDVGRKLLRRTKGVHVVFPHEKLPIKRAISIISPVDRRVMFALPWRERTVVGTTDTDFDGTADDCHADEEDADYLVRSANSYFPDAHLTRSDIISTWTGLRPLINEEEVEDESDVSREHEIFVRDDGIVIIAGGKLTTYRRMAKEVVKATVKWLKRHDDSFKAELERPRTKKRPLPGAAGLADPTVEGVQKLARQITDEYRLDYETADHLTRVYGVRARRLAKIIDDNDELGLRINADLPYVWAEVAFAAKHDLAQTIDDVLARRVPLLLVGRKQGLEVLDRIADILAEELGWSPAERTRHIDDYKQAVADSRRFRDD